MQKLLKWPGATFLALVCGLLAGFSFRGWESPASNSSKVVSLLLGLQQGAVSLMGGTLAGLLFTACAIGILLLAWHGTTSHSSRVI